MSVSHVAGPVVCVAAANRVIQRCCICGDKLIDNRGSEVPLNADGTVADVGVWREHHYVHVSNNTMTAGGDFLDKDVVIPTDFCLALVEE